MKNPFRRESNPSAPNDSLGDLQSFDQSITPEAYFAKLINLSSREQLELVNGCWRIAEVIAAGYLALVAQQQGVSLETFPGLTEIFEASSEEESSQGKLRLHLEQRNALVRMFNLANYRTLKILKEREPTLRRRGVVRAAHEAMDNLKRIAEIFDSQTGVFSLGELHTRYYQLGGALAIQQINPRTLEQVLKAASQRFGMSFQPVQVDTR